MIICMELGAGSLKDVFDFRETHKVPYSEPELLHLFRHFLQIVINLFLLYKLSSMHSLRMGHRDIKPGNIIYSLKDTCWKFADFGDTKEFETEEEIKNLSRRHSIKGTR